MTDVKSFEEIAGEVHARAARIVWCTVATIDRANRPRVRILHPVWEGSTAWIMTGRDSHKKKHLAHNPHVSLSYWDVQHEQIYADCVAEWVDDSAEKTRIWNLFKDTAPPYGYDGTMIWPNGPETEGFGVLKCTPWRVEISAMTPQGFEKTVWRS